MQKLSAAHLERILNELEQDHSRGRISFQPDPSLDLGFCASWSRYRDAEATVIVEGDEDTGLLTFTFKTKEHTVAFTNLTAIDDSLLYMKSVWNRLISENYEDVSGEKTAELYIALGMINDE